jgi:Raf kinase inhibitor-like YbhB/YbcL family protein
MRRQVLQSAAGVWMAVALLAGTAGLLAQAPQGGAPAPGGAGRGGGRGPQTPPLIMTTTAFEDGGVIPDKYTQAAGPTAGSPALSWTQVPMGTQSFALIMHDPEPVLNKGSKMDITHWLVWNIPATATGLPEGVAKGAQLPDGSYQISATGLVYRGPGAAATGPMHHYMFDLYALDTKLDVQPTADAFETRANVMKAVQGHVLGKAVYGGLFKRPQ